MNVLTVRSAPLPTTYQDARNALAKCIRVDECREWQAKAQALASYARQMRDESLLKAAQRIQDRAMVRAGELLLELEAAKTGPKLKSGSVLNSPRKQAAVDAGLSERQAKDAVAAAKVPAAEAEALIEGDDPPTPTALAEMGRKKRVEAHPLSRQHGLWVYGIKALREVPECGLAALAEVQAGLSRERLLSDANAAITNIESWIEAVEEHGS